MDLELDPQGLEDTGLTSNLELTNEIVTVSMLQIALRSEARRLQAMLNELGGNADTATPEGLFEILQKVSSLLLDHSRYWTHVHSSSQTVGSIGRAEELYNQLSLQERSKFSTETLTNVNGQVTRRSLPLTGNPGQPDHMVVTLLLGTADDQPVFGEIYSASVLRDVLENIRMMQARYLLVFETLWTPQDVNDSLTEADLAAAYEGLVSIA